MNDSSNDPGDSTPAGAPGAPRKPGQSTTPGATTPSVPTTGTPPGASKPITAPAADLATTVGAFQARRLTRSEYNNTVRDLLGDKTAPGNAFPIETMGASGFLTAGVVGSTETLNYEQAAQSLASAAVTRLGALVPCAKGGTEVDDACAETFIKSFGKRAYRRPVETEEVASLLGLYKKLRAAPVSLNASGAIQGVLEAMLQSPRFVYLWEDGVADKADATGLVPIKPYALASQLSYLLWSTMPDEELFGLADSGKISDGAVLEQQATRLLADPRAADALKNFNTQLLRIDKLDNLVKDGKVYPAYNDAVRKAMAEELDTFVVRTFAEDAKLGTLLTGTSSYVNAALAKVYGLQGVTSATATKTKLPEGRAGMLTMPGFLSVHATPYASSPVKRGVVIRENLLCQHLAPPPTNVEILPPPDDPKQQTREVYADHMKDSSCIGCHQLMDPLGFGLENFDGLGQFRAMEKERPVNAGGSISGVDQERTFKDAPGLAKALLETEEVQRCMATQWTRFALGRDAEAKDQQSLKFVQDHFLAGGLDMKTILIAVVKSRSFRFHRAQ